MEAALFALVFHQWSLGSILVSTPYVLHIRSEKLHFRESGFSLSSKPPSEIRERKGREKKQVGSELRVLLTPCEHFQLTHLLVSSVVSVVI